MLLLSTWDQDGGCGRQCGAAEYIPKSRFDPDQLALSWRRAHESDERETASV